ncbi:MAG TPA: hypothetical protein DCQ30_04845, partial [Acidimicrobiaceae bacterium]|nr:hypothetical protein [Acidimicrobiaceae bacterium]
GTTVSTVTPTPSSTVPSGPVHDATAVHTGEPWAGSKPYELLIGALGVLLMAVGEHKRRRAKQRAVAPRS